MAQQSQAVAPRMNREELAKAANKLGELQQRYESEIREAANGIVRAYVMGCAVVDMRTLVKQFLPVLRELMGTPLGFKTDLDSQGKSYPDEVVADCAIEAALRGANWVGNEFNILFGGCFLTKSYWWRKITEIPGISDPKVIPGIPQVAGGKCSVEVESSWILRGKAGSLKRTIVVRPGKSEDQTVGKAEARMFKAVYQLITASNDRDTDDAETIVTEGAVVGVTPAPAVQDKPTEADMSHWDADEEPERQRQAAEAMR